MDFSCESVRKPQYCQDSINICDRQQIPVLIRLLVNLDLMCKACASTAMKGKTTALILMILITRGTRVQGQTDYPLHFPGYHVKIFSDNGIYSGQLSEWTDSTISYYPYYREDIHMMQFEHIYTIKIRKPFPAIVGVDLLSGAAVGGFIALAILWDDAKSDNPSYPPFGRTVLTGMFIGTGAGFLYGVGEGIISIKIPINQGRYISGKDKKRVQDYLKP
jgi:hypothetical protein